MLSVQWFWRVFIWLLIELDIPRLSSDGIYFGDWCFDYTYSLQSSSIHSLISSPFDATVLAAYIMNDSEYVPFDLSQLVNQTSVFIIPNGYFIRNDVTSFVISNHSELKQIVIGNNCFGKVRMLELNGLSELESVVIGQSSFRISSSERSDGSCRIVNCPKLNSIQIGYRSFSDYHSFELSNLPSLQSIDIDEYCFYYASSFSLTGLIDWMDWIHRSSSTTISQTWWLGILWCSFDCVWEWLIGWFDDSDLPKLQSIQLGDSALCGDCRDDRKTINNGRYYYKNTLTMRSDIEWNNEWIDLPSLTSFKGDEFNFKYIGSVILESSHLVIDWTRYPSIRIQWSSIRLWLLPLHLFPPILKYSFSHLIIIRCSCPRIIHQE